MRVLTARELYLFGVGCMLATGIYVLSGNIVRDKAGPAGFLSFFIAGIGKCLHFYLGFIYI